MNDQIKQKLIEDIDNNVAGLTNIQIMQIADIINSQPPADQWIPCSERLPDESGRYLIQGINSHNGNPYFAIVHINVWNEKRKCWLFDGKPVAWQPLPEPYKGVE